MMTDTLNNNKLLEIKLVFTVISIALFYILKMHIEYRYGKYVPLLFGLLPIVTFYKIISRESPTDFKDFILAAILSLSGCFLLYYFGVYTTGSVKSVNVAVAESVWTGIGTATGAVIGIIIHYIEKYYRKHKFSLERLLSIVANCAVLGYIFTSIII